MITNNEQQVYDLRNYSEVKKTLLKKSLYKDLSWDRDDCIRNFLYAIVTPDGNDVHYWIYFQDYQGVRHSYPIYRSELRRLAEIVHSESELDVEEAYIAIKEQVGEISGVTFTDRGDKKYIQVGETCIELLLCHGEIIFCSRMWLECDIYQEVGKHYRTWHGVKTLIQEIKSSFWFQIEVLGA